MDLLHEIRRRLDALPETTKTGCLEVLRHLEHCDRLLSEGRSSAPEFFNDIVYRTNQAFEGALKEAYRTLEGKDPDEVSLYKVETTFTKNSLVRPRVIELMKHYRTEWRNPSTHDYKLRFDESEGILAIAAVSAFFLTLLGQINDKVAIAPAEGEVRQDLHRVIRRGESFSTSVVNVIVSAYPALRHIEGSAMMGRQATLLFAEALAAANGAWKVTRDAKLRTTSGAVIEIDLLVSNEDESVPIEIKAFSRSGFVEDERLSAIDRMRRYLRTAGYSKGVLVRLPQRGEPLTNKLVATTTLPPPEAGKRDEMVTIIEVGYSD